MTGNAGLRGSERGFAFIHVPRTGGSSLSNILDLPQSHVTAYQAREKLDNWDELFSFAFVRNPWDKAVSYWLRLESLALCTGTFDAWVMGGMAHFWEDKMIDGRSWSWPFENVSPLSSLPFICDLEGNTLVDFVGKYERFDRDARLVCWWSGVGWCDRVPHLRHSLRRPYEEYYTGKSQALVGRVFAEEIERFGYEF